MTTESRSPVAAPSPAVSVAEVFAAAAKEAAADNIKNGGAKGWPNGAADYDLDRHPGFRMDTESTLGREMTDAEAGELEALVRKALASALLDDASAEAQARLDVATKRIEALEETLKLMTALDDMGGDDRLTEAERRLIFAWIPHEGYAAIRARITEIAGTLPALEDAVAAAEAAVNDDAPPAPVVLGPAWWERTTPVPLAPERVGET